MTVVVAHDVSYTQAFEYSGSDAVYIGLAALGSAKSDPVWQIRKLTYDGSGHATDVQYAAGTQAFDKVWNDRATLSYS